MPDAASSNDIASVRRVKVVLSRCCAGAVMEPEGLDPETDVSPLEETAPEGDADAATVLAAQDVDADAVAPGNVFTVALCQP